jgi:hypothetical protein
VPLNAGPCFHRGDLKIETPKRGLFGVSREHQRYGLQMPAAAVISTAAGASDAATRTSFAFTSSTSLR